MKNYEKEIKQFFQKNKNTAIKSKSIAKKLGVTNEKDYIQLKNDLNKLFKDGLIEKRGKRYKFASNTKNLIGTLKVVNDGYGFVIPKRSEDYDRDIFISRKNFGNAIDGDIVLVKIKDEYSGRRPIGEIIKVVERVRNEFVGKLVKYREQFIVKVENKNINLELYIPPNKLKNAKVNDLVLVRLLDDETNLGKKFGEIVEVIGSSGENVSDMIAIAQQFGFKVKFTKEVLKEVENIDDFTKTQIDLDRLDFRDKLTFTIDPFDAKDYDDAISFEKIDNNLYEIGVHIADVSYFVKENSEIDKEACKRGTSVYLVNYVIPMLPEKLTNDICSLVPMKDRLCYSVIFNITSRGVVKDFKVSKTIIKSKKRFTYEEVEEILERGEGEFAKELQIIYKISEHLLSKRLKAGSLDFDNEEIHIKLDKQGKTIKIFPKLRLKSHRLIEEFMLLANKIVATVGKEFEDKKKFPFIYRVHDYPNENKINDLFTFVSHLGYKFHRSGVIKNKHLQELLEMVKGKPEEKLVNMEMIRAMAKAVYSTKNIGHYGLAFDKYTHFTSPIRRYPDLLAHRLLFHYLTTNKKKRNYSLEKLEEICQANSESERRAAEAEREAIKFKVLQFLKDKIDEEFVGIITSIQGYGIFVELTDYFVDGLIRVDDLPSDIYQFDESNYILYGRLSKLKLRIGEQIRVAIKKINFERKEMDLEFISRV